MSKQDDLYLPTNEQTADSNLIMPKIFITILFSSFLLASPVYAENGFQYLKPIQTDNLPGYKSVVLDKDVYAHSNHLQDLRIFNETDEEVPYVLDSIHEAATSKEKASFIQSEEAPFVTTQVSNDTVISIKVNQLSTCLLYTSDAADE